jgi:hypothetical protein
MDRNTDVDNAATLNIDVVENSVVVATVSLAKSFLNISKIEFFVGENFRRWQERIFGVLDMHGVAWVFPILRPVTISKHIHMEPTFVDTPF